MEVALTCADLLVGVSSITWKAWRVESLAWRGGRGRGPKLESSGIGLAALFLSTHFIEKMGIPYEKSEYRLNGIAELADADDDGKQDHNHIESYKYSNQHTQV
jgi:hypothetical protein